MRGGRLPDVRLVEEMKRVVTEQSLGFVATVRPGGTPALSPKGTTRGRDDERLVFTPAPGTVADLTADPAVEVDVVDPIRPVSPPDDDGSTEEQVAAG